MQKQREAIIAKNRLEALVDGIFAFAMTLLVASLTIPHLSKTEAETKLLSSIGEMQSEFISFLVAFFVLASFWIRHNRQFSLLSKIDSGILRITLFIMVCVIMMPFSTSISGDYSNVKIAVDIFHANMFGLGVFFLIHWKYLTKNQAIVAVEISSREAASGTRGALITPGVAALGFVFSYISPPWSMATYLLIIPCYALLKKGFR
jgi:uncharacterized membrane protein